MYKGPWEQVLKGPELLGYWLWQLPAAMSKPLYEQYLVEGEFLLAVTQVEVVIASMIRGT